MAQNDIFGNLMNRPGGILTKAVNRGVMSQDDASKKLIEMIQNESAILEKKKEIYKLDLKQNGVLKGLLNISKKLNAANDDFLAGKKYEKKLTEDLKKINQDLLRSQAGPTRELLKNSSAQLQLQLGLTKLQNKQMSSTLPLGGKLASTMGMASGAARGIGIAFKEIGGLIGLILAPIEILGNILLKPLNTFLKMQSIVGNLSADIGLTSSQSKYLLNNFAEMSISASMVGASMEDVATIIKTFSQETGKNRIFNKDDIQAIANLGLSTGLGVQGAAELVSKLDNIGVSLHRTIELTDKGRAMASKLNINSTKMLTTYKDLVVGLTGYEMRGGLDNMLNLAAAATSLRMDISGVAKDMSMKFFDPEGAVEAAAKLQVLGGSFGDKFGDPFGLMYAAQNAPELLVKNLMDATKGLANKGADGTFFLPPAQIKIIREAASALGQNADNLITGAIEQAKIVDKMSALSKKGISFMDESDRMALSNLMTFDQKKHEYVIKNSAGVEQLLSELTTKDQFKEILNSRAVNENAAIERKTTLERFGLILDRFMMGFSQVFVKLNSVLESNDFMNSIEKLGKTVSDQLVPWIESVFNKNGQVYNFLDSFVVGVKNVFTEVQNLFNDPSKPFLTKLEDGLSKIAMDIIKLVLNKSGDILNGNNPIGNKVQSLEHTGIGAIIGGLIGGIGGSIIAPGAGTYYGGIGGAMLGGIIGDNWNDMFGGSSQTQQVPQQNPSQNINHVNDALMTPSGQIFKGGKGDIAALFDMAGMGNNITATREVVHSGSITVRSEGGKEFTLKDLEMISKEMFGTYVKSTLSTVNKGYASSANSDMLISPI